MDFFDLTGELKPSSDQKNAIEQISKGFLEKGFKAQVLLGATGTGKTFTMANIIKALNKNTLILAHNKTLAAQLWSELKAMFPNNPVEYFVSVFDYYQPEAYVVKSNTYIEKSSVTNSQIEMMNLSALNSLVSNNKTIVVSSVAAIYPTSPPHDFVQARLKLKQNQKISISELSFELVNLDYKRNDYDIANGSFGIKGDLVEIGPSYLDTFHYRISFFGDEIEEIAIIDPITKQTKQKVSHLELPNASLYVANKNKLEEAIKRIKDELEITHKQFLKENKLIEAQRIYERVNLDLESLKTFGFCSGIENYARHLELRSKGQTPYTLFDYFKDDWLLIIDESHMMVPQIRGMFNTDKNRKEKLVEYGFRLPSALDNRPLNFEEFENKTKQVLYVSATPNEWEIENSSQVVEQIIRPTGLVDPIIEIRPTKDQIFDLEEELKKQILKKERTFITVITIKLAEELSEYLRSKKYKVAYLHNELKTIERTIVLNNLRKGVYDAVIGINLLREGLDVPEVSLVLILDADKTGLFRSQTSLIQTIGRAARNANGKVILYADVMTDAIKNAIEITNKRREIQIAYNKKHNIIPKTIIKPINLDLTKLEKDLDLEDLFNKDKNKKQALPKNLKRHLSKLKASMLEAAKNKQYEKAALLRDLIFELEAQTE